jgi:light-regulated signal transduction histidine kinase (bacteriophytochrome)
LEEDYADKLDETGKNLLQRVRLAAARMETLIDDLLNLSRIGRASVQPAVVDLSAMVAEIVQALKDNNPYRQVEVTIEPQLDEECDRRLMNVVLTNLLDNAWKYTRMQPCARIEFGREWLDGKSSYYVRDNGVGFDMAYADKLFQPFQRLHSMKDFPGSGIGLATVARIIHLHGGHIEAQSEPGKGATFTFVVSNHH